ncbi:MAG: gliding motility-associated C-terminal domain-containing protein, partial [Chitinophagaceae bacterium]|nr:gliding motility-associated C-terminal domain-containing protein [Chitinophagaceae bacterium]
CEQSAEMTINYTSCCGPISVPNAFSPNGDMINDEFKILSQNDFEFFNMKVYNRYGQLVFEGKNSHNVWDGRLAGRNAEMGTYFYIIQTRCHLQEKNTILKGDLLLVR